MFICTRNAKGAASKLDFEKAPLTVDISVSKSLLIPGFIIPGSLFVFV
jgi:hypothetical protein